MEIPFIKGGESGSFSGTTLGRLEPLSPTEGDASPERNIVEGSCVPPMTPVPTFCWAWWAGYKQKCKTGESQSPTPQNPAAQDTRAEGEGAPRL